MRYFLFILSALIVSLGNPSAVPLLGPLAASIGYSLFFFLIVDEESNKKRFLLGTLWFAFVSWIQYTWVLSHPYLYIYPLYFLVGLVVGAEMGLLSLFVNRKTLGKASGILALAGFWVFLEWIRLFWLAGLSFNPTGMALASTLASLQAASIGGVYLLSFFVMATNCAFLALIKDKSLSRVLFFLCLLAFPYLYGLTALRYHEGEMASSPDRKVVHALLVQTAFEVEEDKGFLHLTLPQKVALVTKEWEEIARLVKSGVTKDLDLIVLPESVIPFASGSCLFPKEIACETLSSMFEVPFGSAQVRKEKGLAKDYQIDSGICTFVCNGYFAQGIANQANAAVLIGMEHIEEVQGERAFFSSALLYHPEGENTAATEPYRYDKQVLVPMAEYIPFGWLREAAEHYGVFGSFTPGCGAKLFVINKINFGVSICYDETFGSIVRQIRSSGAEVLVNLTNDGWYPDSSLPRQHFDLAVLRAVENGAPVLRACNTGITCAIDSLGRPVAILGETGSEQQNLRAALPVTLPVYTYDTLYTKTGDALILLISLAAIGFFSLQFFISSARNKER
ncbi:apolipoprotein N-acyltransferase [Estrella lausannensis]|uniref:Apolipoprotein N-acyltransferase n=1 Tax=Estrella lausannensis TaxID=483423 RepID=A0A0H5DQJ6_9BACT|nr:apolipoprotein N-acyltransferase [Estrella lausannensis]CRX37839.1 Apolipoprotein N-acyltransferase [Estrella lausannensis]